MTIPITSKDQQLSKFRADMLNKSLTMFEWSNLPDSLPAVEIEKQLQTNGYTIIAKVDGNVYAFDGGFSGQDPYGNPTNALVNNPCLKNHDNFVINEDCVVIKNDDMQQGLIHIFNKYGTLLIENQITMLMADYNYRMPFTISAQDDSTIQSAKEYLNQIVDGSLGVIGEAKLFDSLKVVPTNNKGQNLFADLYGYQQFIEAELNNIIGLATNNNMKRERLTTNEIDVNKNATYPLIDNMLRNRKQAVELINKMFDLDIDVEFSSVWNDNDNEYKDGDEDDGNSGSNSNTDNDVALDSSSNQPKETDTETTQNDSGTAEKSQGTKADVEEPAGDQEPDNDEEPADDDKEPVDDKEQEQVDDKETEDDEEPTDDDEEQSDDDEEQSDDDEEQSDNDEEQSDNDEEQSDNDEEQSDDDEEQSDDDKKKKTKGGE